MSELTRDDVVDDDPQDFWDSLWENEGVQLCADRTSLTPEEHAYVLTRRKVSTPALVRAFHGADPQAWCPLHRDHGGAHVALIAFAHDRGDGPDHLGWFMEWGPSKTMRRWMGSSAICDTELTHTDGTAWRCYLHRGHVGECRRSVQFVVAEDELDLDDLDFDPDELQEFVSSQLLDAYLTQGTTIRELAREWFLGVPEVREIIHAGTTQAQRDEADAHSERLLMERSDAEEAWHVAEARRMAGTDVRRAEPEAQQGPGGLLEALATKLKDLEARVTGDTVVMPLYGAGELMAQLDDTAFVLSIKMDYMEDWESFDPYELDRSDGGREAMEVVADTMRMAWEDGVPVPPDEVDALRELATMLSDLDPVLTESTHSASLTVRYDAEARVVVSLFDHTLAFSTWFTFGDVDGDGASQESLPVGELAQAVTWVRATLQSMPRLKEEAAEEFAEMEQEDWF
jgi:hypothetical protein